MPNLPLRFFLLIIAFVFLVTFVQLGVLTIAFDKLGLSPQSAYLLFMTTLVGSFINLPLFTVKATASSAIPIPPQFNKLFGLPLPRFEGKTLVAVNVGGCLTPLGFSIYLLMHNPVNLLQSLFAIGGVATVSYLVSRPVQGLGIGIPIFVAPVTAALIAVVLNPAQSAPLAYIGGTLGVLIGADLLRLKDIKTMGTPFASIGGAGTFDGIFITGIVAVLLA